MIASLLALMTSFENYRECEQCSRLSSTTDLMNGTAIMAEDPAIPDDQTSLPMIFCTRECMDQWANDHGVMPSHYTMPDRSEAA